MGYTWFGAIAGFIAGWALHWYWTRGRADLAAREFDYMSGSAASWEETPLVDRSIAEELATSTPEETVDEEASEGVPVPVPTAPPATDDAGEDAAREEMITVYCARCRVHRPVEDPQRVVTDRGRHAVRGTCGECGGKVFSFVPNPE